MKLRTGSVFCVRALIFGAGLALMGVIYGAGLQAQSAAQSAGVTEPASRIVAPVSDAVLTTLQGNVHPLALARYDRGAASEGLASGRMMMLLRRSSAQAAGLDRALGDMRNPASPHYREWLTPASYGAKYGVSDADLAAVTGWLKGKGLAIERVPEARNLIVFSGTVGMVERAFHTSIHRYMVAGVEHYANASDPQIPLALAPVVAGISPMNDFRARPQHEIGARGAWDAASRRIRPQLTLETGMPADPTYYLYVDPADAATIYNTPNAALNAKYAGSKSLDGTGVTIGVLGYSQLNLNDVANYRTALLNDTNAAHLPQVVNDGNDPGLLPGGDAIEALLDTEISGGLAPGAAINYYTAASTNLADGLTLAALRAIDDNQVGVLSVSYGNCEAELRASGNALFAELWGQAASQGITVVVSSGDSGSAACDDDNTEQLATQGLAVSGLASTPYNIAVGGTDFDALAASFATYVSTTAGGTPPYYGTALGYIPEFAWNDSVMSDGSLAENSAYLDPTSGATNIAATGGGASCAVYPANPVAAAGVCPGTLTGYPKPPFQTSITAEDGLRDLPDVSLLSANGKYQALWVLCSDSTTDGNSANYTNCQTESGVFGSESNFDGVGGTSAAAPAFAGMLALVSQSLGGVRLGQANDVLYNLAKGSSASTVFHTIQGNNSVPCVAGSLDCLGNGFLSGYNAGPGYSEAAGLGSVNATALVNAWPSAVFTSTSTSLEMGTSAGALGTGGISVTHGTPLYFAVGVTPAGAAGTVSVTNTSKVPNNAASSTDTVTLASDGTGSFTANNLPGGTYTVSAYYAGDATHAASTSAPPLSVTVGAESSTTTLNIAVYDPATGKLQPGNTFPYGFYAFASAQSYGNNSTRDSQGNIVPDGVATGYTQFDFSNGNGDQVSLNSLGVAQTRIDSFYPASYTMTALYTGDASLTGSNSSSQSFTVTQGQTSLALQPSATSIAADASVTLVATLTTDSVDTPPNASMELTSSGNFVSATTTTVYGTLANGTVYQQTTFTVAASALATGTNSIAVRYPGEMDYLPSSATTTVTVLPPTPSFILSAPSIGIMIASPGQSGTGTLTLSPANGFTGTVALSCSVTAASNGVTPTCSLPSTVAVTGTGAVTAVLSVSTTAGSAANSLPLERWFARGAGIALGWVVLFTVPRRRRGRPALAGLLSLISVTGVIGCGGGSSSSPPALPGTPAGTYTVKVSGTSGSLSASTQVTVTLQ